MPARERRDTPRDTRERADRADEERSGARSARYLDDRAVTRAARWLLFVWIAMTRVLLTYSNAVERKLAARRACRLAARGVDVDLATASAATRLPAAAYDRVLEASSCEPVPAGASDHEGRVYIASAGFDRIPRAPAVPPVRAPAKRTDVLAALITGAIAAVGLTALSLPVFYPVGAGLLVTLATFAVLSELHAPAPFAMTPSGSTPLARCG